MESTLARGAPLISVVHFRFFVCNRGPFSRVALLTFLASILGATALAQVKRPTAPFCTGYQDASLGFRYSAPSNMANRTERFRAEIQQQAESSGTTSMLHALLALSTGDDDTTSNWGSVTIETYPRRSVSEPDDHKAAVQMNAWVADSKDAGALPKSVVISGQNFTVSVFGLQEGTVKKGAVVFTTVRKGKLLSLAFAANSPEQLQALTETMKNRSVLRTCEIQRRPSRSCRKSLTNSRAAALSHARFRPIR